MSNKPWMPMHYVGKYDEMRVYEADLNSDEDWLLRVTKMAFVANNAILKMVNQ